MHVQNEANEDRLLLAVRCFVKYTFFLTKCPNISFWTHTSVGSNMFHTSAIVLTNVVFTLCYHWYTIMLYQITQSLVNIMYVLL